MISSLLKRLFDLPGKKCFTQFAREQLLAGQKIVAGKLLGYRAAAAGDLATLKSGGTSARRMPW